MKLPILIVVAALCSACQSYPRTPNETSSQSGVSVYGVVDVGVSSTK